METNYLDKAITTIDRLILIKSAVSMYRLNHQSSKHTVFVKVVLLPLTIFSFHPYFKKSFAKCLGIRQTKCRTKFLYYLSDVKEVC